MKFGDAIGKVMDGTKMARWGWHGEGMYITSLFGKQLTDALKYVDYVLPNVDEFRDAIVMYTGDHKATVGWVPSQEDMTADDWVEF